VITLESLKHAYLSNGNYGFDRVSKSSPMGFGIAASQLAIIYPCLVFESHEHGWRTVSAHEPLHIDPGDIPGDVPQHFFSDAETGHLSVQGQRARLIRTAHTAAGYSWTFS
jgi:hypothetical protein